MSMLFVDFNQFNISREYNITQDEMSMLDMVETFGDIPDETLYGIWIDLYIEQDTNSTIEGF